MTFIQDGNPSAWYDLILNTSKNMAITLQDDVRSYLTLLLVKFVQEDFVCANVFTIDFLQAQRENNSLKIVKLHNIADKCLIFTGLYKDNVLKRNVSIDHFVNIGQRSYFHVYEMSDNENETFYRLGQDFNKIVMILNNIREQQHFVSLS